MREAKEETKGEREARVRKTDKSAEEREGARRGVLLGSEGLPFYDDLA